MPRARVAARGALAASILVAARSSRPLLLSPFRLGRLLRSVSLPRMREHRAAHHA